MNGKHATFELSMMEVGGPMTEAIVGLAALALAIIGLAHVFPWLLASIATIALGAAFIFEAGTVGRRFSALTKEERTPETETWSGWGGVTSGFLSGCAGVALGILALLGIATTVLVPVAVIIYGVALVMDSGTKVSLSEMESEQAGLHGVSLKVSREAASALSGIQVLMGLGSVALGILAIIKIVPQTLCLVAILAVGSAILIFSSFVRRFLSFRENV